MVETKQSPDRWELWQELGGRGRGAILAEAPGRGVTLAGACCNVGSLSQLCLQLGEGKGEKDGIQGSDCSGVRRERVARRSCHFQAQLGLLLRLCCAAEDCPLSCPLTLNTSHGQAHGTPRIPPLNHRTPRAGGASLQPSPRPEVALIGSSSFVVWLWHNNYSWTNAEIPLCVRAEVWELPSQALGWG